MALAQHPLSFDQVCDDNGSPYPGAKLYSYAAGTDTPQAFYADVDGLTPRSQPVVADAGGRMPALFALPTGYDLEVKTTLDVLIYTQENWSDIGAVFSANFGTVMAVGSRNVTSGYTLLATDRLVTVASSGATTFNLTAASARVAPITIKNMGAGTVVVTPAGANVIEGALTTYTIEAAATPLFPAITLYPVTGGWLIVSSHRAA